MVCVRESSSDEHISQSDCTAEIPCMEVKNVIIFTRTPFCSAESGLRMRLDR